MAYAHVLKLDVVESNTGRSHLEFNFYKTLVKKNLRIKFMRIFSVVTSKHRRSAHHNDRRLKKSYTQLCALMRTSSCEKFNE